MSRKKLVKVMSLLTGLFILTACSTQINNTNNKNAEANYVEDESADKAAENNIEESESGLKEEITDRMTPREALDYMFDYLCPDKSDMVKIVFVDLEGELSYTFYYMENNYYTNEDEISDPFILFFRSSTQDGLYYNFALYEEIWDTVEREDGYYKEFSHNSFLNYWYINTETKEIIPRTFSDEEANEDEDCPIFNEKYDEI